MLAHNIKKLIIAVGLTAGFAAAFAGTALSANTLAAGGGNVVVSPGTVDSDGTEGSYAPAIQGKVDSDGDQDAYSNGSWVVTPQDVHPKS